MKQILALTIGCAALLLGGCQTTEDRFTQSQAVIYQAIANEPQGDYFIGRRFYRRNFFFWGYIRQPRQPWSTAKLVMLNEQKMLAPDRQANTQDPTTTANTVYRAIFRVKLSTSRHRTAFTLNLFSPDIS